MSHKRLLVVAAIVASAVVASFLFSVPRTGDVSAPAEEARVENLVPPAVSLRDSFKKGVHTITGSVETPDACATASAQALLEGDAPENQHIVIAISLEESEGVCLELPTRVGFSATLTAPAGVPLSATVNGAVATTTAL